jgi:hypothetical protein
VYAVVSLVVAGPAAHGQATIDSSSIRVDSVRALDDSLVSMSESPRPARRVELRPWLSVDDLGTLGRTNKRPAVTVDLDRVMMGAVGVRPSGANQERRRLWPYFAIGGAGLGAASVLALAVANCDAGCRDDGAVGLPQYVIGVR